MKYIPLITSVLLLMSCSTDDVVKFGWGDNYTHYEPFSEPAMSMDTLTLAGWKGETVSAQALVWMPEGESIPVSLKTRGVKGSNARFIAYVMADVLDDSFGQCGCRAVGQYDSLLVADPILDDAYVQLNSGKCQPVWLSVSIPASSKAGVFQGTLQLMSGKKKLAQIPYQLRVVDKVLKPVAEWEFHLDLWQNPYSVARVAAVEPWSPEHFEALEPVMRNLARAGQKVITTTIMDRPWNGQTEDPFQSMVSKTLNPDGSWNYDFSIWDKWVDFMTELGIDRQINCYSLIPWHMQFDYIDGQTGEIKLLKCEITDASYENYWKPFLQAFANHLKERGLFEKTFIAMDERPLDSMKRALEIIKAADPDFKVSLAGAYHQELALLLDDYSIASIQEFPADVRQARRNQGKVSTYYTCCAERYPNTYLVSSLAEACWIGWSAYERQLDGYLRWAYNSWTTDPVSDARFRAWPAGDCFIVYPGNTSSMRFEKLIEGIQDYQKLIALGADAPSIYTQFTFENLVAGRAQEIVKEAHETLNQ